MDKLERECAQIDQDRQQNVDFNAIDGADDGGPGTVHVRIKVRVKVRVRVELGPRVRVKG